MTNREIANQLNISPAALSLILNHKPGVSDSTRERVLKAITDMGYSHLIKKRQTPESLPSNFAFVIYKKNGKILNQHPFFLLLMESIENRARKYGYNIMLTTIDKKMDVMPQIRNLEEMNIKGVIIFATEMDASDIQHFEVLKVPFVAIDNNFPHLDVNTVCINNEIGTYQAVEYLVNMGHKKIGYLQSNDTISSFCEREQGYQNAMNTFGLSLDSAHIFKIPYTEEGSYQAFKKLLDTNIELPTAFVSDDDTIATGVMKALTEKGLRIPEDVSIVGFNDRPSCEISSPPLTSINVPRHSFGSEAVDALVKMVQRREHDSNMTRSLKLRIGTQLTIRSSVAQQ
ncbi:MAG: LacI family DNA-binding transcriptional regulator [Lachnospiraceae bacterium]|nr:LacI family DNA-binding transcriptional regulator [Lachnospiraceae bacterium]